MFWRWRKSPDVNSPYTACRPPGGEVVVTLEGIDAETAEVSLLHDEDGDYKMKTGERGPAEGYAAKKCTLPAERNAVTIRLRYPAAE